MASVTTAELYALLDHLAEPAVAAQLDDSANPPVSWQDWTISRVTGSLNNRIYRATSPVADLAIKLTIRDQYNRAIREYHSLQVLERAGLAHGPSAHGQIARGPRALLLEQERYQTPIVVLSWVTGEPLPSPPTADDGWRKLVELYAAIHSVTPAAVRADLAPPVLIMRTANEGLECIRTQLRVIPEAEQPPEARELLARLERHPFPTWSPPPVGLCQADGNFRNLLQRPGGWAAVDWEYSGWGDPAFEFASIIAHAAYLDVPPERWAWARELYLSLSSDPGAAERVTVYTTLMYGFWVGRFARMLYEIPRGRDQRLTPYPDGWLDGVRSRYARYLQLADDALTHPG